MKAVVLRNVVLLVLIGCFLALLVTRRNDVMKRRIEPTDRTPEIFPCQTSKHDFLQVRDFYFDWKPGFNHKSLDFFNIAKLAVRLNRILVDFPIVLDSMHNKDKFGKYREGTPIENSGMWTWGQVYDLERAVFTVYNHGTMKKCRFQVTKIRDLGKLMRTAKSVVTYEYSDIMFKEFTETTLLNSRTILNQSFGFEVDPTVRYSSFFRASARNMMENCATKLGKFPNIDPKKGSLSNPNPKFYSIHVRLGDRQCLRQLFSPKELISRLREFRLEESAYVYIMTDAPVRSNYWNAVETAFSSRLCWAKDMKLFEQELFSSNNYMVYIAEKALQLECDAFIESFEFATPFQTGRARRLGNIAPTHCDIPGLPTAFPLIEAST